MYLFQYYFKQKKIRELNIFSPKYNIDYDTMLFDLKMKIMTGKNGQIIYIILEHCIDQIEIDAITKTSKGQNTSLISDTSGLKYSYDVHNNDIYLQYQCIFKNIQ